MIKQWCKENSNTYTCENMTKILAQFIAKMDGSTLTETDCEAIRKMYEINPEILSLLCNAFEDKGYESF